MDDVAASEGGRTRRRRRVVAVAVDEGEESICALRWSLRNICAAERDVLVLLYARPPPPVCSALDASENGRDHHLFGTEIDFTPNLQEPETGYIFSEEVTASIDKYSRDLADSVMEKAKNICKAYENIRIEEKVAVGDARDVICDMVDKLGADLLVMGSHGYGFIKRALLGSVSDYCIRNAKCPVLIVKRPVE
ncbi:universal stress protein A-like protein isoform X1 [Ananas comosus]|uniref:Universal stress protein A-like protein n=1 Tax=Ananas comosus TaxID=4615 RepID=A0A199UY58_ANACO|nr:universal stress protein A-like protein isoform X1 [Ananas comosus]OAY69747.1 Universal stress protein A-like protein [Ananas comosus]